MIAELLRDFLPKMYNVASQRVNLIVNEYIHPFSLSDYKACEKCHASPQGQNREDCNEDVLRVDPQNNPVQVINFEEYIQELSRGTSTFQGRCDFLMYSNTLERRKIVFCDLTCSESKWLEPNDGKYPEGKKAKARMQMEQSLQYLEVLSVLSEVIYTCQEKQCILGWRDYNEPSSAIVPEKRNVSANLQAFMTTPSSMAGELSSDLVLQDKNSQDLVFKFSIVKYPHEYKW